MAVQLASEEELGVLLRARAHHFGHGEYLKASVQRRRWRAAADGVVGA